MKEGASSEAKTILVLQGFGLEGDSWSMVPKQCSSPLLDSAKYKHL